MRISGLLDLLDGRRRGAKPHLAVIRDFLSQLSPFRKWSIPS